MARSNPTAGPTPTIGHDVKDLGLAAEGVNRIEWAARDMPVLRSILRDVGKDNNRFSAIVLGVVKSAQFQMRVKAADEGARTN